MNLREIKELIELLQKSQLTELEVEKSGVRVRIRKDLPAGPPQAVIVPPSVPQTSRESEQIAKPSPGSTPPEEEGRMTLNSPVVGTFFRAPAPDADACVEVGDSVKKGEVICIIEAMKLMNEIESEYDGKIVAILVENGQAVEYGEPLFRIEPDPGS